MTSTNRVWIAAGVAVVNGHTEQGYKLRSLVNSFRHGVIVSDLRPFSSLLRSNVNVGDVQPTQSDDSLKQVMYMNCWGQS
nr:thiolase-like protein [Tanacetum cinerariifolium]